MVYVYIAVKRLPSSLLLQSLGESVELLLNTPQLSSSVMESGTETPLLPGPEEEEQ